MRHLRAAGRTRRAEGWAVKPQRDGRVHGRRAGLWHRRLRRRCLLCRAGRGADVRLGLPPAALRDLVLAASRRSARAALLHSDRVGAARRGHELPRYLPAGPDYAEADPALVSAVRPGACRPARAGGSAARPGPPMRRSAKPMRRLRSARDAGILAVEMAAAALYAFAAARGQPVLCFAHVTNQMGQAGDFEKGEADGATASLALAHAAAGAWRASPAPVLAVRAACGKAGSLVARCLQDNEIGSKLIRSTT